MSKELKYRKELYTDSGMYSGDMECEIDAYEEKLVKCRKPHVCATCQRDIPKGDYALREHGFFDHKPVSAYTCVECVEAWLEESGQVGFDSDDNEGGES